LWEKWYSKSEVENEMHKYLMICVQFSSLYKLQRGYVEISIIFSLINSLLITVKHLHDKHLGCVWVNYWIKYLLHKHLPYKHLCIRYFNNQ